MVAHLLRFERGGTRQIRQISYENWPVLGVLRHSSVRTFHQRGIERDDVEQRPHAQMLERELAGNLQLWKPNRRIKKEFHRVIARLAMNVDATGEVGSELVVHPVVVGEPG